MKGMLKVIVLKELFEDPVSGYSLMDKVEESLGSRPSPGSIYPLLAGLKEEGFIKVKEEGRKKIYSLTPKGKRHIKQIHDMREKKIMDEIKFHNKMDEKLGIKDSLFGQILERMKNEKDMFPKNFKNWLNFRNVILRTILRKDFQKIKKEFFKLLKETEERIKKL